MVGCLVNKLVKLIRSFILRHMVCAMVIKALNKMHTKIRLGSRENYISCMFSCG
jgi:hypothetical protein